MFHVPGLFNQAILESGAETNFWVINWPEQEPETYIEQVAEALGCPTGNSQAMLGCLQGEDWEDIANVNITCTVGNCVRGSILFATMYLFENVKLPSTLPLSLIIFSKHTLRRYCRINVIAQMSSFHA